jgi:hypothetical protein
MKATHKKIKIKIFTATKIANATSNTECFIFLPDRQAPAQRSATAASYIVTREGLTFSDGY